METPGFSTFVVGTDAPVFDLGNATLTAVNETDGQVEATVPVENVGTQTGTYTARLRGDGTVLATTTITVPPGETATASVQTTMPDADGVTLSLAGQSIGELTVTETAESTEPAATPTDDDALPVLPSFILILLLVVLGVILGWLSRQTTEDNDS